MKPLYLDWNLGLGDAIICNGLVRVLAQERPVIVPCYPHNFTSVAHMFSDLKNVEVRPEGEHVARPKDAMAIGLRHPQWGSIEPFDKAFYAFAGVPHECRWSMFKIPRSGEEDKAVPHPYLVTHDDPSRGFRINTAYFLDALRRVGQAVPIMPRPRLSDWRFVLKHAEEIHCIDSSVLHLVEHIDTRGKLFFHRYARPAGERWGSDATRRKDWTVIE